MTKPRPTDADLQALLRMVAHFHIPAELPADLRALADALDQQAAVSDKPLRGALTWEQRIAAFNVAYYGHEWGTLECAYGHDTCLDNAATEAALKAAFPEYAPND